MFAASKDLNINPGLIKYCCEGKPNVNVGSRNLRERDMGLFMNHFYII